MKNLFRKIKYKLADFIHSLSRCKSCDGVGFLKAGPEGLYTCPVCKGTGKKP